MRKKDVLPHLNPLLARRGFIWILCCLFSFNVHAECTPTPDCASIGYTDTLCEGDFIKCPFDTSKLFCVPCDNDFKYTCSGSGYSKGEGTSCRNKYIKCVCASGYEWNSTSGRCEEKPNCTVGMIYYSDKSCSSSKVSGKQAIGIVVKDNELIVALYVPNMSWASNHNTDVGELTNYTSDTSAQIDYNGKANTLAIVSAYTSDTSSNNAAVYCNSYSTEGTNAGDWYLPATGELYDYIYSQYSTVKAGWDKVGTTIFTMYFWSSSEYDTSNAWGVGVAASGLVRTNYKMNIGYSVSCFLDIS